MKHKNEKAEESAALADQAQGGQMGVISVPAWDQPPNPGKRFEIRTPNRGFNETRAGVKFQEGVGYTDDEAAAEDCARFGYEVTDCKGRKSESK